MAYTSSKFTQAEVNYATIEQELLALVRALIAGMEVLPRNVHRNRIADGPQPFGVFTNAKNAV